MASTFPPPSRRKLPPGIIRSATTLGTVGTAREMTAVAAFRYFSSSIGESVSTSPMLSNPCPVSSGGNSEVVS